LPLATCPLLELNRFCSVVDALADRRGGGSVRVRGEGDGSVLDRLRVSG